VRGWRRGDGHGLLGQEGRERFDKLVLVHSEIVVQQVQKLAFKIVSSRSLRNVRPMLLTDLLLHQVDLGQREKSPVTSPVFALGARVVEVFRGDNEGGEEDTVTRAGHALGQFGQTCLESVEVNESAEECGGLYVAFLDELSDEGLEAWKSRVGFAHVVCRGRRWRREWRRCVSTLDDRNGLLGEEIYARTIGGEDRLKRLESTWNLTDHATVDRLPEQVEQGRVVHTSGHERSRMTPGHGCCQDGRKVGRRARRRGGAKHSRSMVELVVVKRLDERDEEQGTRGPAALPK
jgi:hypothetical protein